MAFIVVVNWPVNSNENIDLYPDVLKGMTVRKRFRAPQIEFLAFDTEQEALELKARIEKQVPLRAYLCVDHDNRPIFGQDGMGKVVPEPQITTGRD